MKILDKQKRILKALVITLELLALALVIYIITLPLYPEIEYGIKYASEEKKQEAKEIETVVAKTRETITKTKVEAKVETKTEVSGKTEIPSSNKYAVSSDRLVITKIGVNAPIVESNSAEYGLSLGAWRVPDSSTPDKGGNTVITGHRFKYLPPSNLTFYLLDKLEKDDIVSVFYKEKEYYYRVREVKVVDKDEVSILGSSENPILTLFTCHPIYSTNQRLVVVADLLENE